LTNNILGAAQIVENSLETDETDEVPDLPHLPPTFLAHHAKGIGAPPVVNFLGVRTNCFQREGLSHLCPKNILTVPEQMPI